MLYHISWINLLYAETLLDYFHSKDLILCKRQVNNETKHRKKRYLVVFTLGDLVFSQTYNSIRELKADTGRKPSQIRPKLTQHLLCSRIALGPGGVSQYPPKHIYCCDRCCSVGYRLRPLQDCCERCSRRRNDAMIELKSQWTGMARTVYTDLSRILESLIQYGSKP